MSFDEEDSPAADPLDTFDVSGKSCLAQSRYGKTNIDNWLALAGNQVTVCHGG